MSKGLVYKSIIIVVNCFTIWGQEIIPNLNDLSFKHISSKDGLSQRSITDILQDDKGYLWFGTRDGLNKYDGDKITVYRHNSEDTTSLNHSWIKYLFQDTKNNIWIGTREGLSRYHPQSDAFVQYKTNKGSKKILDSEVWSITQLNDSILCVASDNGLSFLNIKEKTFDEVNTEIVTKERTFFNSKIRHILTTKNGDLWICTVDNIGVYNTQTSKITIIDYPKNAIKESYLNNPPVIFEDSQSNVWLGYDKGLAIFNKDLHFFKDYGFNDKSLINSAVRTICEDTFGNLWVGTYDGLFVLNSISQKLFHIKHNKTNPKSLSQNSIYDIIRDSKGDMWIGTWAGGVNYFDRSYAVFDNIISGDGENMLNYNIVSAIVEDKAQNLWIGTEGGGINYYDKNRNKFTYYLHNINDENSVSSNNVKSIIKDSNENLWIGTHDNGLNFLNPNNKPLQFERINPKDQDNKPLSDYKIVSLFEDSGQNIWIGTLTRGVLRYDKKLRTLKRIDNTYRLAQSIVVGKDQNFIIIGGSEGIEKININTLKREKLELINSSRDDIDLSVNTILIDNEGNYWIGTEGNGLFYYDETQKTLTKYGISQGLPNEVVYGMLQDEKGYLWISTNKGLSRFNPLTKRFKNFTQSDGLQSNEFNYNAYIKTSRLELIFGGVDGITMFNPNKINKNTFIPNVDIYEIKVNNETFTRIDDDISEIILKHNQNNFSLNFTALGFSQPSKNQYAYKLEGFDKDWIDVGNSKTAIYTNIEAGNYIFRVKASNSDGLWNETGDFINIKVQPSLWKTWWAYLIYCLVALGLILFIRTLIRSRIDAKRQLEKERIEKEKIEGINKLKLKFFTNISHEFRTPLTLILGPLQKLIQSTEHEEDNRNQLELIQRNTITLLELINQLLNFRKSEAGELKLQVSKNNLIDFIREIKLSFDELAERRHITYSYSHDVDQLNMWFDILELKKVFINILSNAFKFTPKGGEITINVKGPLDNNDTVKVSIKDSGIGIPKEKIKYIFDRYFQLGVSKGKRAGTGLGLSLAKDIIELHQGSIQVDSAQREGVTFTIKLPLGEDVDTSKKMLVNKNSLDDKYFEYDPILSIIETFDTHEETALGIFNSDLSSILLVEDNQGMRKFIRSIFEDDFNVFEANNGKEGLEIAQTKDVDIIISDIMMPIMDGVDMCHNLKSNIKTSHIPIILLTAKSSAESQKEGYKIGADVYVTKPFDVDLLKIQVSNLFNLRNNVIEKFKKDSILTPKELTNVSTDEKFLEKAFNIVQEHMGDNGFNAQQFTDAMGVSRTLLYNKLKALTGQSITEFIRTVRLKKAAQYIVNTQMRISEIAYDVGFNDLKYFRVSFKKMYQTSPSEYRKSQKEPM